MKNKGKLLFFSILTFAMMMLFAGCGTKTTEGQITAIEGSTITVSLGEMAEQSDEDSQPPSSEDGQAPTAPSDDESTDNNTGSDSENNTTTDSDTSSTSVTDSATTDNSGDSATTDNSGNDGSQAPPEQPSDSTGTPPGGSEDGTPPDGSEGKTPPGGGNFTASGETMTFDASSLTVTLSDGSEGTVEDLSVNDIISITYTGENSVSAITVEMSMNMGNEANQGANSGESMDLTGAYTVDEKEESLTSGTYNSENSDENAILVTNGGTLTASGITATKTGDSSSADKSNFYGLNAAITAQGGSTITLSGADITSNSEGSNAIFATGEGSSVTVSDTTICTEGDSSRGLDATYGGTIKATGMTITTKGAHCAPVATDRGEGTITISDSTLNAAGDGSPCIYSTGIITAKNVTGTATGSQAAVIEGKNSITLENSDLTGAGENGIMLYQSTSGDATEGTSVLTSTNSTLTTTSDGPMFYITNTEAKIILNHTTLNFSSGTLLQSSGNSTNNWGEEGSNGGSVTLNAKEQTLAGNILCDEISNVTMNIGYSSTYEGTINSDNSGGTVTLNIGKTATVTLTDDSYVTVLTDKDESLSNLISNGHTLYYDADNEANAWLDGQTITLDDGGTVAPM